MFLDILLLTLGLVFGSFISALSFRAPKGISIARGRSFCDNCKKTLTWQENIPLLSFLLQGGKCKSCGKKISIRYPLIEVSTMVGFLVIFNYQSMLPYNFIFCIAIFMLLEIIFITDIEHQIIPDEFVFFGIILAVLYFALTSIYYSLFANLFSGFLCGALLMFVNIITRGRGMGLGDVKFAVLGGFLMGPTLSLLWLLISFLTGAVVGIILILVRRAQIHDKIAFGPFLVVAIILTTLFGSKILNLLGFLK